MKTGEKRLLALLGLVAVAAGYYYLSSAGGDAEYDALGLRVDTAEKVADLSATMRSMPELHIDELNAEKEVFSGARRNLFVYSDAASNDESADESDEYDDADEYAEDNLDAGSDQPPATDETEDDREPLRPTLAGYDYLGYHLDQNGMTAVFRWRGRTLLGRAGATVNDAFEIKEITRSYVLIHVIQGDFEQRLRLESPAEETTSGGMK